MISYRTEEELQIINRIKLYLKNVEDTSIKNMKLLHIINLMNFLSNNIQFIEKNPKFKIVVISKCNTIKDDIPNNTPQSLLDNFNKSINNMLNLLNLSNYNEI